MWKFIFFVLTMMFIHDASAQEDRFLVGAHYYMWYSPKSWQRIDAEPLLGKYDSADERVIDQHIRWAKEFGVDFFGIGWNGRHKEVDDDLIRHFIPVAERRKYPFCLAYDTLTRFAGTHGPPFDFNDPQLLSDFLSDFDYLSKTFFNHPQYLKFSGRPVIWIYIARAYKGDFATALEKAREVVRKNGFDMYIDGDLLWGENKNQERWDYFDAASAYILNKRDVFAKRGISNTGDVAALSEELFPQWKMDTIRIKNRYTDDPLDFHPVIHPQFWKPSDPEALFYTLSSPDDFRRFARAAASHASFNRKAGAKVIWITSWNEWYENTQIEPVHNGPKPHRNYGFRLLEIVREVFGKE